MADHRAEQIIAAVETSLTGLATTGSNVFRGRDKPIQESDLPCILVDYGAKNPVSELGADNVAFVDAWLDVELNFKVRGTSGTDTTINQIAKEAYIAMMADITQGKGFVFTTVWRGDSKPEISSEGNQDITEMIQDWAIKYRHSITDPSQ